MGDKAHAAGEWCYRYGSEEVVARLFFAFTLCGMEGCGQLGLLYQLGAGGLFLPGGIGDSGQMGNGASAGPPVVRLSSSNTSPSVSEQVRLTCTLVDGNSSGVSFAFQSSAGRLAVDSRQGRASFVVDQSDINTEIDVTCTATNDSGTSAVSNRVILIPTG